MSPHERRLHDEIAEAVELVTAGQGRLFAALATATTMKLMGDGQSAALLDEAAQALEAFYRPIEVLKTVRRWRRQTLAEYRRGDAARGRR